MDSICDTVWGSFASIGNSSYRILKEKSVYLPETPYDH